MSTQQDGYIKYIKKVVNEVFSTMIFTSPEMAPPIKRGDNNDIPSKKDVSGIVGLGGTLTGTIIMHFEKESALKVTSNMLGVDYREIDDDVKDAVGEISNMIAGGVKVELSKEGIDLDQALPIVVSGSDFSTSFIKGENSVMVPFSFEGNSFFIEYSFKK